MTSLYEIASAIPSDDPVTKPLRYYEIYDRVLREEGLDPLNILEIGVHRGHSTQVLAERFPDAKIVALDVTLQAIDFSRHSNVNYLQCDQTDAVGLRSICSQYFPRGIDLVIEDASHIGQFSALTFHCLFPYLNSRGIYIIEDWGTGYWDSWVDGTRFGGFQPPRRPAGFRKAQRSHDSGMVGFVKSLVDFTAVDDIGDRRATHGSLLARLILPVGRMAFARRLADKLPRLKAFTMSVLNTPVDKSNITGTAMVNMPQLSSVKFFRGVCVACKA